MLYAFIGVLVAAVVGGIWSGLRHVRDRQLVRMARTTVQTAEVRAKNAEEQLRVAIEELRFLATDRIPAAVLALTHEHAPVPGLLHPQEANATLAKAMRDVLSATGAAAAGERDRVDAAARAAMRGATAKVQSLLYQTQSVLQDLQHELDDPRLLELDFRNELALRRIQATAVLCEAWPGLARSDSPLAEVVIGAQSRVAGYARIKMSNHLREQRLAVVARAAEPLAIAVAELLANATSYSHPDTAVPVTIQQSGGRGALIVVDDGGIGMDEETLSRARRLLAGPEVLLLTELGNPPQAGFAVVGRLVRQYGFSCHVESSPYGGVRAMLRVPAELLTVLDEEHTLSVLVPAPAETAAPARPAEDPADDEGTVVEATPLPSRRRRSPRTAAARPVAPVPPAAEAPVARTPEQAGALWGALQDGTRSGRSAAGSGTTAAGGTAAADKQGDNPS
ncbi:ATP-binding protein [Streptomyces cocklensis]|uniref:histidine kinase n=1 Tax=Actinacidiphila cocklensis TaxID=887465 RepID=A0A9W4GPL8_9ACTN|nr:ATP-binding protein [Actinacidiphila cocklensis]MDD1062357.1 ATP-binding protein [Actinacidiphila cocklensis]WSX74236.1 ATP-binding protein [Streptomyces sp. NBC_00899]WSX79700.1 ATP-binding protein [Streptomyces sp. NBC_00899]CAG6392640.1 Signal transduction histidine kinase [Actinacidiphila cocklensis]